MTVLLSLLWIPYIALIFSWMNKPGKQIYVAAIIIITGVLGYRLPVFTPGARITLFHMGLFVSIATLLVQHILKKKRIIFSDPIMKRYVLIFFIVGFITVFLNRHFYGSIANILDKAIGFSLLFFVTVVSLRKRKDIFTLMKVFVLAAFIWVFIGVTQFFTNNDQWGVQVGRQKDEYGTYFKEKEWRGFGTFDSVFKFRIRSTTSGANPFGTVMATTIPFTLFFLLKRNVREKKYKYFVVPVFFLQMFGLIISGSRSAMMAVVLMLFCYFSYGARQRGVSWGKLLAIICLLVAAGIFVFRDQFFSTIVLGRIQTLEDVSYVARAGVRMDRYWIPYIQRINFRPLLLGFGWSGIPRYGTPHNDLLAVLYFYGLWGFIPYILIIKRSIKSIMKLSDKFLMFTFLMFLFTYLFVGLGYETYIQEGAPYIFWPLIAIIASHPFLLEKKQKSLNTQI